MKRSIGAIAAVAFLALLFVDLRERREIERLSASGGRLARSLSSRHEDISRDIRVQAARNAGLSKAAGFMEISPATDGTGDFVVSTPPVPPMDPDPAGRNRWITEQFAPGIVMSVYSHLLRSFPELSPAAQMKLRELVLKRFNAENAAATDLVANGVRPADRKQIVAQAGAAFDDDFQNLLGARADQIEELWSLSPIMETLSSSGILTDLDFNGIPLSSSALVELLRVMKAHGFSMSDGEFKSQWAESPDAVTGVRPFIAAIANDTSGFLTPQQIQVIKNFANLDTPFVTGPIQIGPRAPTK